MTAAIPQDPQGRQAALYLTYTDSSGAVQTILFDLIEKEEWSKTSAITENPVEAGVNITDNIRVELRKVQIQGFLTNEPIEDNQWTTALQLYQPLSQPSRSFSPVSNLLLVPEWKNNLEARILLGTVAGAVGSAVGGAAGAALGLAGAIVGDVLFKGQEVIVPVPTNAGLQSPPAPPDLQVQTIVFDDEDDFVARTIQLIESLMDAAQTFDVIGTKSACIGPGGATGLGGMAIESFTHTRDYDAGTGAAFSMSLKQVRVVYTTTVTAPAPTLPRAQPKTNKGNQETSELGDALSEAADSFVEGFGQGKNDILSLIGGNP